uniref:Putative secreted protein n=1 Tax=Anopheles darlingi TaxID=43151 RepID=A0A2M4DBC6_ANODA
MIELVNALLLLLLPLLLLLCCCVANGWAFLRNLFLVSRPRRLPIRPGVGSKMKEKNGKRWSSSSSSSSSPSGFFFLRPCGPLALCCCCCWPLVRSCFCCELLW